MWGNRYFLEQRRRMVFEIFSAARTLQVGTQLSWDATRKKHRAMIK
jgi:hypothetical protein